MFLIRKSIAVCSEICYKTKVSIYQCFYFGILKIRKFLNCLKMRHVIKREVFVDTHDIKKNTPIKVILSWKWKTLLYGYTFYNVMKVLKKKYPIIFGHKLRSLATVIVAQLVMSKNHVGGWYKKHKRIHILSCNPDFSRYYAWVIHKAKIAIINAFFGQFLT